MSSLNITGQLYKVLIIVSQLSLNDFKQLQLQTKVKIGTYFNIDQRIQCWKSKYLNINYPQTFYFQNVQITAKSHNYVHSDSEKILTVQFYDISDKKVKMVCELSINLAVILRQNLFDFSKSKTVQQTIQTESFGRFKYKIQVKISPDEYSVSQSNKISCKNQDSLLYFMKPCQSIFLQKKNKSLDLIANSDHLKKQIKQNTNQISQIKKLIQILQQSACNTKNRQKYISLQEQIDQLKVTLYQLESTKELKSAQKHNNVERYQRLKIIQSRRKYSKIQKGKIKILMNQFSTLRSDFKKQELRLRKLNKTFVVG